MSNLIPVFARPSLKLIGGQGTKIWTETGEKFLDCISAHGVSNLGHGNQQLTQTISKIWQNYACATARFGHPVREKFLAKLAEELSPTLPEAKFFLSNSGTEAVEAALKFARVLTKRTKILAAKRAFHGRTFGSLSATWRPEIREPFAPLVPDFDFFTFNDLASLAAKIDQKTAAVILEPIQGEAGVYPATRKFLQGVRKLCRAKGALLICDEVQTGLGRTGKFLASEHLGIKPDLICLAKALGNGYPIGATAIQGKLLKEQKLRGLHSSTFGGNVPACAVGLQVLNLITRKKLVTRAAELGQEFKRGLQKINSPLIREVRGLGLMLAIEFKTPIAGKVTLEFRKQKILVLQSSACIIRFLPPLIITKSEIRKVINTLEKILLNFAV